MGRLLVLCLEMTVLADGEAFLRDLQTIVRNTYYQIVAASFPMRSVCLVSTSPSTSTGPVSPYKLWNGRFRAID
jgi:hypothetical protein